MTDELIAEAQIAKNAALAAYTGLSQLVDDLKAAKADAEKPVKDSDITGFAEDDKPE
jgi:hypothetical protein